jgi:hypothetical protein
MNADEIRALVSRLDATNAADEENAWDELRPLGAEVVPYLAEAYPRMKKWQGRVACVFHSIRYARTSDAAYELGIAALQDRATLVRYRACGLLAYSLRREAIAHLKKLRRHSDKETADDARAAIDAIKKQNHHFFIDRRHTGQVHWRVNEEDTPACH